MSGSNIISCQVPVKVIIMKRQCNTGARCNKIQSGVTILCQMYQYQVIACVKYQVILCQVSSIRYQVPGARGSTIIHLSTVIKQHVSGRSCDMV